MKTKQLTMNGKIVLLTFFIIAFSFLVAGTLLLSNLAQNNEETLGQRAMLVARTISDLPDIHKQLEQDNLQLAQTNINKMIYDIKIINKAEYIVVMNMDRIKLSHPSPNQLGQKSNSTDIDAAFSENYYISKAIGEQGEMVRAFVPILNDARKQIGVVVVGFALPTFLDILKQNVNEIFVTVVLSILFSIWGAHTLGRHIKHQMFGLEPQEIAKVYVELNETFNAMHEGIIAVDKDMIITIFNKKASNILGVRGNPKKYIGKYIFDVLPDTRLPEIVESGRTVYNQEIYVNSHSILSNRIPIFVNGKTVGAVAVFKDLTEFKQLAEELTGVKAFVQALRIQTHEYKNKLHTIAGLLQLGHHQQALDYLSQVKIQHDEVTKFLNERIYNENISGLLLSKISRGKELGIDVKIDEESQLTHFPALLDHHDFVLLFGNLIENAFDALVGVEREYKEILISIDDNDGMLAIMVSDNGVGIPQEHQEHILESGFSTKQNANRGIGLFLINEIVKKVNGTIEISSEVNKGTTFILTFEF
ncbi:sensor histidine kinase [Solibacillus sp. MA9]|uniref:histidine kinase n=1 Tax=Solibacillus palustris TaxID=2908203 RepID=A0ABS9U9U6_9BACL|nr:sensor histidine kinase [Solibacillus sp. MA9]MCH7321096.1 sensor histidine kinase [Solibacillus sp. MA9]